MKISDVLRSLADAMAEKEAHDSVSDNTDSETNKTDNTTVFVSPLQQKMELLKKSVGVENIYDDPEEQTAEQDELEHIKKLSGLASVVHQEVNDPSDPT